MKEKNINFRSKLFLKQHYGFITLKTTLKQIYLLLHIGKIIKIDYDNNTNN